MVGGRYVWFFAFVLGCASPTGDDGVAVNEVDVPSPDAPPAPPHETTWAPARRKCVATEHWRIEDCDLYHLACEDGEDWALLCPTRYFEPVPEVPLPPYP